MKIYKCMKCGKMVEEIKGSGCVPMCCGEFMTEMKAGASDGAFDKHVPVYETTGTHVSVKVGSTEHPSMDAHYIEWIAIETTSGSQKKCLKPGMTPAAEFELTEGETVTAVYAYCNLHGLWKA